MPGSCFIVTVAAVGLLAGYANRPAALAPSTAPSSRASLSQQAIAHAPTDAARTATTWAAAYCGWSYRALNGQREANARVLMTASAGADLAATSDETWDADVVAARQVAACSGIATHILEGPQTPTTVYLLITATRTVTDDTGTVASSPFTEPRRIVLIDARWLVDARVEGG